MNHVIRQNTRSRATIISLIIAICFVIGIIAAMVTNLPVRFSLEWFLFPLLLSGGILLSVSYSFWLIKPKEASITISSDSISIFDAPRFRWVKRNLDPNDIKRFVYKTENRSCWFEMVDQNTHHLSDLLAIKHEKIAQVLQDTHSSIQYEPS